MDLIQTIIVLGLVQSVEDTAQAAAEHFGMGANEVGAMLAHTFERLGAISLLRYGAAGGNLN